MIFHLQVVRFSNNQLQDFYLVAKAGLVPADFEVTASPRSREKACAIRRRMQLIASEMNPATAQFTLPDRPFRRLAAVICLALFLTLQIFVNSGALHHSFHVDASSSDHQCAVTLLTGGQVNAPILPVLWIAFAAILLFSLPSVSLTARSAFDYRFSASRAPPRF